MHEVIVVGAGPSGSAAAIVLAQAGCDVLLLDRAAFPRDKPCGDAISNNAIAELEKLGVWQAVHAANFRPTTRARSVAPCGRVVEMDLPTSTHRGIIARRSQFDTLLKEHAVQGGATFQTARVVEPVVAHGRVQGVVAHTNGRMQELRAAVVIAADGASSVLATKIRHKHYPPACHAIGLRGYVTTQAELDYTTHMHFIRDALPGYAWMFPVAPDCANVGVWTTARQHRRSRRALQAILDTFLATPAVVSRLGNSYTMHDFQGWKLTLGGSENDARAFPGALLVGDAGAFVNPATGAGIAAALMTGRMAAEVIVEALDEETGPARDRVLRTFDQRWRNELSMRLRRGYMVQQLVLSWPEPLSLFNHWAGEYPGLGQTLLGMLDQFT